MPEIVFHALEDRSVEQKRAPGSHRRCGEKLHTSWMHGDHQVVELARRIGQGGGVLFSEMADKPCPPSGRRRVAPLPSLPIIASAPASSTAPAKTPLQPQDGNMEQLIDLPPGSAVGASLLRFILARFWFAHW